MPTPPRLMTEADLRAALQRARRFGNGNVSDALSMLLHENHALGDHWFNEAAPITLGASATNSVVVEFQLPQGMIGILRSFAMNLENSTDFDNVRWAVRINRNPLHGFDNIRGPISTVIFPVQVLFPIFKDGIVDIVASNLTAIAITNVTGMVRGTFWAPESFPPELLQNGA